MLRHGVQFWGLALLVLSLVTGGEVGAVPLGPDGDAVAPESLTPELQQRLESQRELRVVLEEIKKGKLDSALQKIHAQLKLTPDSAPGEELLGVILVSQGRVDEGLTHLQRSVALDPRQATAITKIGDVYLAQGKTEKAKAQFLNTIGVNPSNRQAHQRLGLLAEEARDYPRALRHFEQGIKGTSEGYVGIKVNLGRIYNRYRQYRRTTELLAPVLPIDSENAQGQLVLGISWLGLEEPAKALARFSVVRALDYPQEEVLLSMGIAHREAGNLESAQGELKKALELKPDWTAALYHLAETHVAAGEIDEALDLFEKALKTAGDEIPIRHRMAEVLTKSGKVDEALGIYEALRAGGKANLRTYQSLAAILTGAGRLEEAGKVLEEACQRFPEHPNAHFLLGMHYALVVDYPRGLECLTKARKISSWDPRIRKAISLVCLRQGEFALAIQEAEELVKLVPWSVEDQFYLGTLFEKVGKDEDAALCYDEALRIDPNHVATLNNLAQVRMRGERIKDAVVLARKAAKLQPEHGSILDTLGWALYLSGELSEAREVLEKAVQVSKGRPHYRYRLAVAYAELEKRDKAREQLALALKSEGDFPGREAAQNLSDKLARSAQD